MVRAPSTLPLNRRQSRMRPKQVEAFLGLMRAKAPRQTAEALLEFLANDSSAVSAALFAVSEDACELFSGSSIDQEALDWCYSTWNESSRRLSKGFAVQEEMRILYPIKHGDEVVGLVFIEAPYTEETTILDVSASIADSLLRARCNPMQSAVQGYVEHTPLDEMEKEKLKLLFQRHEFRHARVARALNTSRVTLYRRLDKYGLREFVEAGREMFRAGRSPKTA